MKKVLAVIIVLTLCVCMFGCGKPDEATQIVIDEIAELEASDHITLDGIAKAKERYNSLSDKQKEKVSNYATLLKMEDNYEELGQIVLTPENIYDYMSTVKCEWALCDESGENISIVSAAGLKLYPCIECILKSSGRNNVKYNNVKLTVKVTYEYVTMVKDQSTGEYLYDMNAPTDTTIKEMIISCDELGDGSVYDIMKCEGGQLGPYTNEVRYEIIDVSGTVLPLA